MSFRNPDYQDLCRVCLTKSTTMVSIFSHSERTVKESPPMVLEVLEFVMSTKLILNKEYPLTICAMCKGLLKIAYDLKMTFDNSQKRLEEIFQASTPVETVTSPHLKSTTKIADPWAAPVELIVSGNKYNLDNVVIVEEEDQCQDNFNGFLNNLGSAITAVFVNKSSKEQSVKRPIGNSISLEKISKPEKIILETNTNCNEKTKNDELDSCVVLNSVADSAGQSFLCKTCNITYASYSRLMGHVRKFHTLLGKTFLCDVCGNMSIYNQVKSTSKVNRNTVLLSCSVCKSITTFANDASSSAKLYPCQFCNHLSHNRGSAYSHKKKHSGPRYQCNICDKIYDKKEYLKGHINKHRNIRNHLCTVCGKTFIYRSALVYHMRIHTNERNYCCNFCDKRFNMANCLKRHIRTHTGIRPYNCSYCEKRFFSTGEKRKHEMIHLGCKPYKCKYCSKSFITIFNRNVHYMSHSGPHSCDLCPKTFIDLCFLKSHVDNKHKNEDDETGNI